MERLVIKVNIAALPESIPEQRHLSFDIHILLIRLEVMKVSMCWQNQPLLEDQEHLTRRYQMCQKLHRT